MKLVKLCVLVLGLGWGLVCWGQPSGSVDPGEEYFQRGQFEKAVEYWEGLSKLVIEGQQLRNIKVLTIEQQLRLAEAYQQLGRLKEALKVLQEAESYVQTIQDSTRQTEFQAGLHSQLSDVYLAMGNLEYQDCKGFTGQTRQKALQENLQKAKDSLDSAENSAAKIKHTLLQASILNQQGNLLMAQKEKDYERALEKYEGAKGLAEQDKLLKAKILMNIAQARVNIAIAKAEVKQGEKHVQAQSAIQEATTGVHELSDSYSHDKSFALIGLSRFWRDLHQSSTGEKIQSCSPPVVFEKELNEQDKERFGVLMQAMDINKVQENRRTLSYAKGYLAELYLEKGCYSEAKELTEQAIFYAGNYPQLMTESVMNLWGYPELLFQWERQRGRILKALGQPRETVIATYEQAEKYLKAINYRSWSQSLREGEKDFYMEFGNLLLKQAVVAGKTNSIEGQFLLEKTIKRVEQFKAAELRNYFQDDCVVPPEENCSSEGKEEKNKDGSPMPACTKKPVLLPNDKTAVFYPLLIKDKPESQEKHLELLLYTTKGIRLLSPPQNLQIDVGKMVVQFRTAIEKTWDISIPPKEEEKEKQLESLIKKVFKETLDKCWTTSFKQTDKHLQALEEHEEILKKCWAQPLYQALIKPVEDELARQEMKIDTLLIIPDGILRMLPFVALHDGEKFLIEKGYSVVITPGLNQTDTTPMPKPNDTFALLNSLSKPVGIDYKALHMATEEIKNASDIIRGFGGQPTMLADEKFTISNVREELRKNYSLLHFTTHGHFDRDPNKIFLLTFDSVPNSPENSLKINTLKEFISSAVGPVDLVVLSACQSALGDSDDDGRERASLGLAGVAVRTGARSAVATLWTVDADATLNLIGDFYKNLASGKSKAQALKEAQKDFLSKQKHDGTYFTSPYYWAAFILIGNWRGYE